MKKVLEILSTLKNISGTNEKIDYLSSHKENNDLKMVLNLLYNPRISTKLANKKLRKSLPSIEVNMSGNEFIEFLSTKCAGKDSDIQIAQSYLNKFDGEYKDIMFDIITQKLSIGMDYKNINKSFGYPFIEFIECMLATNVDKVIDKIGDEEYYITMKLDGNRFIVQVDTQGNKTAYSRNGLPLDGYEEFLNQLVLANDTIYDGEILYSDDTLTSEERFRKTNEIVRSKGVKDKDLLQYHIFDVVSNSELRGFAKPKIYSERRAILDSMIENKYQKIVKVLYKGMIDNNVFELLDRVTEQGNEGLMGNLANGEYQFGKRSKNILKFKKFHDVDLLCIGVTEGEGKYKGKLGSITVEYFGYYVEVGTGFTDEMREYYWKNQNEIVRKIVQVKYFEESRDKNGNLSMRFPIMQRVRTDKQEVSYD